MALLDVFGDGVYFLIAHPRACTRMGLLMPEGTKSMSPLPSKFFRAAVVDHRAAVHLRETEKAMRVGMLALMMPVMTFTEGRCVAMTRCMPSRTRQLRQAADAVLDLAGGDHHQVRQFVDDDDDLRHRLFAVLQRLVVALDVAHAALGKALVALRHLATAQSRALAAFFGSVTTGAIRWGMPL